jgi:hypothetical protein
MTDLEKEIVPNDDLLKLIKKKLKIKKLSQLKSDAVDDFVEENIEALKEVTDTITDLKSGKKEIARIRKEYLKKYKEEKKSKKSKPKKEEVHENPLTEKELPEEEEVLPEEEGEPEKKVKKSKGLIEQLSPKEKIEAGEEGEEGEEQEEEDEEEKVEPKIGNPLDESPMKFALEKSDGEIVYVDELNPGSPPPLKEEDSSSEEEGDEFEEEIVRSKDIDEYTISQHRKAYVNWVNKDFYKKVQELQKDSPLNIYQVLVQKYLGLETPYRGLLVYHGLGTGKTATAISLAEGLSKQMKINTMLPASLKTEFIKEVQRWGQDELNKDNLWKYYSTEDLKDDVEKRKEIRERYKLDELTTGIILKKTIKSFKDKIMGDDTIPEGDKKDKVKEIENKVKERKGIWVPDEKGKKFNFDKKEEDGEDIKYDKEFIVQQINYLIELKYNFINYNPFPQVKSSSLKEFMEGEDSDSDEELIIEVDKKEVNTKNKRIVKKLEKQLEYNRKHHHVNSPFYKEVIIIDEVHNFVRQVINGSKRALLFYEWIVNAKDVKLIFLSGTPVINKPSEIAILYNMLKGLITIYTFSIKTDMDSEEITSQLNELYYKKESSIELFFVEKKLGKVIISYIQERSGFESLMDEESKVIYTVQNNDTNFEEFIKEIYRGLHKIFTEDDIIPSQGKYDELSDKEKRIIQRGDPLQFDKEAEVVFNKQQKLFDVRDGTKLLDMTDNENFLSYFFESTMSIPHKKRILLKRMLMGLTSYYPIDRSSIVNMPQIIEPKIRNEIYENYKIVKDINIVLCPMSQIQFEKYAEMWENQKKMDEIKRSKGPQTYNEDDEIWHYHTRTRQACNIVYQNDDFRMMKKTDGNKKEIEKIKETTYDKILNDKVLSLENELESLSPKMFQIMNLIGNFINKDDEPTGKVLFYSDFRSDAGSEAFELVLRSNGYERFDHKNPQESKGKRYTFITGAESQEERKINRDYYNDVKNKYGEYIQIMIISSAGAEGISLFCVRQVHILDPYWNNVRMDQVYGRAIRMRSHTGPDPDNPWLPKEAQNVEQYLYLSTLPFGLNYDDLYEYLNKSPTWSLPKCEEGEVKQTLSKAVHKDAKSLFDTIITINNDSNSESVDQYLFNVMEQKYTVSLEINSIIKESSLDCIKHTRDTPELNDKCIRFSDKLIHEIAYFPGVSCELLEQIDTTQLKSKYIYHIKPNIYVVLAYDNKNIYIYYEYDTDKDEKEIDIRYIRENGKRLCDIYNDEKIVLNYVSEDHSYNKELGKEFSVYQEMYYMEESLEDPPSLDKLLHKDKFMGYKLKYNINETYYYMNQTSTEKDSIQRIYPFKLFVEENYTEMSMKAIILYQGKIFIEE